MGLRYILGLLICIIVIYLVSKASTKKGDFKLHIAVAYVAARCPELSISETIGNCDKSVMIIREAQICENSCAIFKLYDGKIDRYDFRGGPPSIRRAFSKFVKMGIKWSSDCVDPSRKLFLVTNVSDPSFNYVSSDLSQVCAAVKKGDVGIAMFSNNRVFFSKAFAPDRASQHIEHL
jgi:hypothetical protein